MAATKRNAGLTSAVPRATLNDEELVRNCALKILLNSNTREIYNGISLPTFTSKRTNTIEEYFPSIPLHLFLSIL